MSSQGKSWKHFDAGERDPEESPLHRWGPKAGAAIVVLVVAGAGALLIKKMAGRGAPAPPAVQQISIVLPPPPPPPPKLEEPEPEEVEIEEPEPEPVVDDSAEPPPGQELGLDADGVAGADAFGLRARKGGRGLLGGDRFSWYAGVLQRDLQAILSNDDEVRGLGEYAVVVSISLTADGRLEQTRLVSGSNNPRLDEALRKALSAGVRLSQQPPEDLPQPIRLRISSRG